VIGLLALLGAGVTAFYMTRVMLMTFLGRKRWQPGVHPHESPLVMTVPLIVLGAASVVGGMVLNGWISGWLEPAVGGEHSEKAYGIFDFTLVGVLTLVVVAAGVAISFWRFGPKRDIPTTAPASRSPFTLAGRNDLYGDAFNEAVFMRPGQRLTKGLMTLEDSAIDGTVNGTGTAISAFSGWLRRGQNGFVRSYALTMTAGAALVGVVLVLGRLG
jgi:NADH-quinone oxidoreductase subunit L